MTSTTKALNYHGYQKEAIDFALARKGAAIFADPGLGKTAMALQCISVYRLLTGRSALVVTPLRPMFSTWPEEIENWDDFCHLDYQICHGKSKEIIPGKDLYLVNPEGLEKFFAQKRSRDIGFLIVDESSKFKNRSAKRTKKLRSFAKHIDKRLIMTGTPAPNGYLDLWSQINIVDRGKSLGTTFTRFRDQYFRPVDYNQWTWLLKDGAGEKIDQAIAPYCIRLDGEKLLSLPDLIYRDFHFSLTLEGFKTYDKIERKLFAELATDKGKLSIVQKSDSAYIKCRQFSSGFLYRKTLQIKDGKEIIEGAPGWLEAEAEEVRLAQEEQRRPKYGRQTVHVHDEKIKMLRDLVDELQGKKVAIVYNYKEECEAIKKEFNTDWVMGEGASADRGKEIVEAWNADKIDVLLLHPMSASHGLNLQHGSGRHIIWYSLTDDLEAYQQLNRRIRRQGVKGTVFIYHIIAKGTVDEAIASRLGDKARAQNTLLEALEGYRDACCDRRL